MQFEDYQDIVYSHIQLNSPVFMSISGMLLLVLLDVFTVTRGVILSYMKHTSHRKCRLPFSVIHVSGAGIQVFVTSQSIVDCGANVDWFYFMALQGLCRGNEKYALTKSSYVFNQAGRQSQWHKNTSVNHRFDWKHNHLYMHIIVYMYAKVKIHSNMFHGSQFIIWSLRIG